MYSRRDSRVHLLEGPGRVHIDHCAGSRVPRVGIGTPLRTQEKDSSPRYVGLVGPWEAVIASLCG